MCTSVVVTESSHLTHFISSKKCADDSDILSLIVVKLCCWCWQDSICSADSTSLAGIRFWFCCSDSKDQTREEEVSNTHHIPSKKSQLPPPIKLWIMNTYFWNSKFYLISEFWNWNFRKFRKHAKFQKSPGTFLRCMLWVITLLQRSNYIYF